MSHSHSVIIDEVLKEWNISHSKVMAILTDNANNMLKAFQQELLNTDSAEESETEELSEGKDYDVDFDMGEQDHDMTFKSFGKRLSCFAFTLLLVVNKFSEDSSFASTLKWVSTLVNKVNKLSRATEMLLSECHKKLVSAQLAGVQHTLWCSVC